MEIFRDFFAFRKAPNAKQWPGPTIEDTKDYSLAVIKFDDQGWYHDLNQRDDLNRYLDCNRNEDLLIMVLIHGWKHNAAPDDANLRSFRAVLKDARLSENRRPTPRQILGVYLSWRGLSLSGNWFWMNGSFLDAEECGVQSRSRIDPRNPRATTRFPTNLKHPM
jgi:hypothetical protein